MKENELTALSDQELLDKRKKLKNANVTSAVLIGFMIGIAFYSTVRNGFGFFTFFPLFFLPIATANQVNKQALEKEIALRNLK